jgi:hypothetical protein
MDVQTARRLLRVDEEDDTDLANFNNTLVSRALKRIVVYHAFDVLSWILNPSSTNTIPMVSKAIASRPSLETLVRV